jgi:hypothetical protein
MDDETDTGGAERAFEALRAEVAALRQAVEGQTAPDYTLTLGAIVKELQGVGTRLAAIDALHKCEADAARAGKEERCTLDVQPPAQQVNGRSVGR